MSQHLFFVFCSKGQSSGHRCLRLSKTLPVLFEMVITSTNGIILEAMMSVHSTRQTNIAQEELHGF